MKLLIVRYGHERAHHDPEQAAGFRQAAEKIAGVPGLVWKLWGYDDDQRVATSIYLFDSESNARAWGDGPMVPAFSASRHHQHRGPLLRGRSRAKHGDAGADAGSPTCVTHGLSPRSSSGLCDRAISSRPRRRPRAFYRRAARRSARSSEDG
jgi:Putative mono-oxygenase ydhR